MGVIDGRPIAMQVERNRGGWVLTTRGASHRIRVLHPRTAELARFMIEKVPPDLSRFLICPMPGLLTAISVEVGDKVEAGQPLATVEAMKMRSEEHTSELQSLMRISYAVLCLKKKNQ